MRSDSQHACTPCMCEIHPNTCSCCAYFRVGYHLPGFCRIDMDAHGQQWGVVSGNNQPQLLPVCGRFVAGNHFV
jgi:hypothetical protein